MAALALRRRGRRGLRGLQFRLLLDRCDAGAPRGPGALGLFRVHDLGVRAGGWAVPILPGAGAIVCVGGSIDQDNRRQETERQRGERGGEEGRGGESARTHSVERGERAACKSNPFVRWRFAL